MASMTFVDVASTVDDASLSLPVLPRSIAFDSDTAFVNCFFRSVAQFCAASWRSLSLAFLSAVVWSTMAEVYTETIESDAKYGDKKGPPGGSPWWLSKTKG